MWYYVLIFAVPAILSYIFTPFVKKLAFKVKAIDIPDGKRRIHKKPMPRLGGLAIFLAFTIGMLIFTKINKDTLGIIIGSSIIVAGGIIDDIKSLKPLQKLMFQIAGAIVLVSFGVTIKSITIPFFTDNSSLDIGIPGIFISMIWIIGITNAVNFIDGLDGLACGICLIASFSLFGVSHISNRFLAEILTLILAGACTGFLPYNFNPASIFMGDTGSQFLGFVLAAISIQGAIKSAAAVSVAVPILTLGIPIYDTAFAIIRRKINNKPIMVADRGHFHHRLLDMGLSQKQAVAVMYTISAVFGLSAIFAMKISNKSSYALLITVCAIVVSFGIEFGFFDRKN